MFTFTVALGTLAGLPLRAAGTDASSLRTVATEDFIFSGTISVQTNDKLTVIRSVPGRDAEVRTFTLNAGTSAEGQLRVHARVTVRYRRLGDGCLAADHIIVR